MDIPHRVASPTPVDDLIAIVDAMIQKRTPVIAVVSDIRHPIILRRQRAATRVGEVCMMPSIHACVIDGLANKATKAIKYRLSREPLTEEYGYSIIQRKDGRRVKLEQN